MTPFRSVSVYYPRGIRTGGPEALHQLVDSLRRQGVDAALVPIPGTEHQPDVPDYEKYDAPLRADALDSCDDAIVMPEVWLGALKRQPAHVFWWWLLLTTPSCSGPSVRGSRASTDSRRSPQARCWAPVLRSWRAALW